jgi:ankyrin repeat protein
MLKKQVLVFLLLVIISKSTFSQVPKKTPANASKTAAAAKGSLAADMDCTVKLNGSPNPIQVKAYSPLVVTLKTGENSLEATSSDKKSSFRTTVKAVTGETTLVEISFYDDSRFLEYVKQGNVPMLETAIKKDPALISNQSGTLVTSPLEVAIVNSQPEVAKLFLEKGASYTSPKNIYPLHKAAMFAAPAKSGKNKKRMPAADSALVELFLNKGCDVNEKDDVGNTPLHCAAQYGKSDLVIFLVEKGADINVKNTFGDTPLKLAENKGYITIIEYLKTKGALEK